MSNKAVIFMHNVTVLKLKVMTSMLRCDLAGVTTQEQQQKQGLKTDLDCRSPTVVYKATAALQDKT